MKALQGKDKFKIYQKGIEEENITKQELLVIKKRVLDYPKWPIIGKRRTLIPQSSRLIKLDFVTPAADITYVMVEAKAFFPKLFDLDGKYQQVAWEAVSPDDEPEGKKCYGRFFVPEGLLYFLLQKQGRQKMEKRVREITNLEFGAGSRHERWINLLPTKKVIVQDKLYKYIESFTRHPRIFSDY